MKPAGREIVKKLLVQSDVVIANLPYETLQEMGIDYDTISAINPRIILATTSTFGSEGPYATRVGFDTIGQAMSAAFSPTETASSLTFMRCLSQRRSTDDEGR